MSRGGRIRAAINVGLTHQTSKKMRRESAGQSDFETLESPNGSGHANSVHRRKDRVLITDYGKVTSRKLNTPEVNKAMRIYLDEGPHEAARHVDLSPPAILHMARRLGIAKGPGRLTGRARLVHRRFDELEAEHESFADAMTALMLEWTGSSQPDHEPGPDARTILTDGRTRTKRAA